MVVSGQQLSLRSTDGNWFAPSTIGFWYEVEVLLTRSILSFWSEKIGSSLVGNSISKIEFNHVKYYDK